MDHLGADVVRHEDMLANLAASNILTSVRLNNFIHIFDHFFTEHHQRFQAFFRFLPNTLPAPCECYSHSATGLGDLHREFPGAFNIFDSPSGSGSWGPLTPASDSPLPIPPRFVETTETMYFSLSSYSSSSSLSSNLQAVVEGQEGANEVVDGDSGVGSEVRARVGESGVGEGSIRA